MIARCVALTFVAAAAAGCASTPCSKDRPYERAVAYPYLQDAPQVAAPEPSTEFAIPELANAVDFAQSGAGAETEAEDDKKVCLEVPAALPSADTAPTDPAEEASDAAEAPAG